MYYIRKIFGQNNCVNKFHSCLFIYFCLTRTFHSVAPLALIKNIHFYFDLSFLFQPRNKEQELEVLNWIYAVLGEKVPAGNYEDILKDGIVLCKLANKLTPGSVKKIQERGTNFQLMENVQRFQAAIKKYGVPEEEIFQTADLFERRNVPQVTLCLYSLGRIVSDIGVELVN